MKLLDLFCGAGGASVGYHKAGFEVTGIDLKHGKRYPFTYIKGNVKEYLNDEFLKDFDVIHASPPCQTHSITQNLRKAQGKQTKKIDMLDEVRDALIKSKKPYIIENVPGAPLINPIRICGSSFNLKVRRHRYFESNINLTGSICDHETQGKPIGIYGQLNDTPKGKRRSTGEIIIGGSTAKDITEARFAMNINWMIWGELVEAIPPAYTEYIGKQVIMNLPKGQKI
jgi:DNA (cytosine-5)-methyltransferase 1